MTDDLIGVDRNIPDQLIKTIFLGVTERAAASGIPFRFEPWVTAQAVAFWAHGFLFDAAFYHLLPGWPALGLAKG